MNRLWQISLPLSCCLLGAAIWMALLRESDQLPPLHETWETARYLEAARAQLRPEVIADHPSAISGALVTPQPESQVAVAPAELDIPKTFPESLDSGVLSAIESAPPVITTTAPDRFADSATEFRVSILQRPEAAPLAPESKAVPASPRPLRAPLTLQDVQAAGSHLSYGKTLARKGATASARGEFLNGLAVIAQSRDRQVGGNEHLQALNRAVQALQEALDFYPPRNGSLAESDLSAITSGHLSHIISEEAATQMTRSAAVEAYRAYALTELRKACGEENPIASELLYCLGKLHGLLGQADPAAQAQEYYQSLTFHEAALAADRGNYASANELGVLLARQGRLDQAKQLFLQSVTLGRRRETWINLASVHQRLGETQLAELANLEARRLETNSEQNQATAPLIRLVAPAEFEAIPDTQDAGPVEQTADRAPLNAPAQQR